ncbi:MAG: CoA-binding protein [Ignavibacteria bacterium]|nr:CoA-binding protein [Ignavibacteria bacterium]
MPLIDDDAGLRGILTAARVIAVVGLSEKPWRDSYTVTEYMHRRGYRIIPVNPHVSEVFGIPAVDSLDWISEKPDIVNIFRRSQHIPAIVESAIHMGAGTVWLQSGIVHEDAAGRASAAGLNVVMDRCIRVAHTLLVR